MKCWILSFRESSNYFIDDTKSVKRFFIMNMHVEIIYTILQMLSGDRIVYKMPCSIELHYHMILSEIDFIIDL